MSSKPLFLYGILINILTFFCLYLAWHFESELFTALHPVGKVLIGVIFSIALCMMTYCGLLCWQADAAIAREVENSNSSDSASHLRYLRRLCHKTEHVVFAAEACPYVGMIGALAGIILFFSTNLHEADAAHIQLIISNTMNSLGVAFVPTIVGVFFKLMLGWQSHLVVHAIEDTHLRPGFVAGQ
jgi:MotA/TolQ/ExbB proton channel family